MALPKVDVPTFEIELLSSNEKIKCRPFLVKEQKILTLAVASEDKKEMLDACKQIIRNCCYDNIDVDKLAMFEIQYIFLKLKGKSIGEIQSFELLCGNCNNKMQYDMDINDFKPIGNTEENTKRIEFSSDAGIVLKYPSADVQMLIEGLNDTEILLNSIDYIYNDEEVIRPSEDNYEEIVEFIDNIPLDKYAEAEEFFRFMPTLAHSVEYECKQCKTPNNIIINGYEHFFV